MKRIFYSLLLGLSMQVNAQLHQLSTFSTGKLESSFAVSNKNKELSAYVLLFNQGLSSGDTKMKFEYVLLDKNLSKMTNGDFEVPYHKNIQYVLGDVHVAGQYLYHNFRVYNRSKKAAVGHAQIAIDLKSKAVKHTNFVRDYQVKPLADGNLLAKEKDVYKNASYDYLVTYGNQNNSYSAYNYIYVDFFDNLLTENIGIYDQDFKMVYKYDPGKTSVLEERLIDLHDFKGNKAIVTETVLKMKGLKGVVEKENVFIKDLKEDKNSIQITHKTDSEKGYPRGVKASFINDKVAIVTPVTAAGFAMKGIRRTIYDETGKKETDTYTMFTDILSDIGFGTKKFEDGYKLKIKDIFNFEDESFLVLVEKNKERWNNQVGNNSKTEDYILLEFDAKGNFVKYTILEKTKLSKGYDAYLFAQRDIENKEIIIYYEDLKGGIGKVKEKVLVINKISDGKITQQRIPYFTKNKYFNFSNAKYGHVVMTEYNDGDEAVSIRLERVNL